MHSEIRKWEWAKASKEEGGGGGICQGNMRIEK